MVVLGGKAVSYERGTPVGFTWAGRVRRRVYCRPHQTRRRMVSPPTGTLKFVLRFGVRHTYKGVRHTYMSVRHTCVSVRRTYTGVRHRGISLLALRSKAVSDVPFTAVLTKLVAVWSAPTTLQ